MSYVHQCSVKMKYQIIIHQLYYRCKRSMFYWKVTVEFYGDLKKGSHFWDLWFAEIASLCLCICLLIFTIGKNR